MHVARRLPNMQHVCREDPTCLKLCCRLQGHLVSLWFPEKRSKTSPTSIFCFLYRCQDWRASSRSPLCMR